MVVFRVLVRPLSAFLPNVDGCNWWNPTEEWIDCEERIQFKTPLNLERWKQKEQRQINFSSQKKQGQQVCAVRDLVRLGTGETGKGNGRVRSQKLYRSATRATTIMDFLFFLFSPSRFPSMSDVTARVFLSFSAAISDMNSPARPASTSASHPTRANTANSTSCWLKTYYSTGKLFWFITLNCYELGC